MSGNNFSESQLCVIMDTDSLDTHLDSQQSIPDPKRRNVASTPQPFPFGPQFHVAQTQTFIDEKFCFAGQVHRNRF